MPWQEGARPRPVQPKIIQIQPWRDILLGLTDEGQIYMLQWLDGDRIVPPHFVAEGYPLFSGLWVR